MQAVRAEEELSRPVEDDDRLYELVLLATGSEDRAAEALAQRREARMREHKE